MSKAKEALQAVLNAAKALIDIISQEGNKCEREERHVSDQPNGGHNRPDTMPPSAFSEANQPPTSGKTYYCCQKPKDRKDAVKFWVEIIGAILALGVLVVMCLQMKANFDQAKTAQGQLGEMIRQNQLDERAWVTPRLYTEWSGAFKVTYKNTGKTPAINVVSEVHSTGNTNEVLNPVWKTDSLPYSGLLGPNVDGSATAYGGNGRYFYGKIWYDDIFGSNHWTTFCVYHTPDSWADEFSATPFGNSCDDAKPDMPR